jgi:hypothetical protein
MAMTDLTTLLFVDGQTVMKIDLSLTISCEANPLAASLSSFPVSKPDQAEVFQKYSTGVALAHSGQVWSFVGYRKVSAAKNITAPFWGPSPNAARKKAGFHFTKSLLCFRPCKKCVTKAGSCEPHNQYGKEKCCVHKDTVDGAPAKADESALAKLQQEAGMIPIEKLEEKDGLKVF